jgi:hypothetical protein
MIEQHNRAREATRVLTKDQDDTAQILTDFTLMACAIALGSAGGSPKLARELLIDIMVPMIEGTLERYADAQDERKPN